MEEKTKKIDIFKLISGISLIGIFLTVGIAVLMLTQVFPTNATMFQILIYIGILCLGLQLCLNWVKYLTIGKYKILSIIFICFVGFCSIMWIVGVAVIFNQSEISIPALKFLKIDFIVTLQFLVANFIATCLLRYKKSNIVFQTIAYLSYLFLDFWLTSFVLCLTIDAGNGLSINTGFIEFLFTKPMYSLLALSVVYVIIVNAFTRRAGVRRRRVIDNLSTTDEFEEEVGKGKESVEFVKPAQEKVDVKKKLEDLKSMLDQDLITQEEYDKKKAQLLDQM